MNRKFEFVQLDGDRLRANGGTSATNLERLFNELGAQGYQLVASHPNSYLYTFQREAVVEQKGGE